MRHLKRKKVNENIDLQDIHSENETSKSLKVILLLSWIFPFIAMFIIHLSKKKLPEKVKQIVYKILNMNFTVILTQFVIVSAIQPLALMAIITGLWIYWIISHIIGTVRFLRNEDYSYKFSMDILKP